MLKSIAAFSRPEVRPLAPRLAVGPALAQGKVLRFVQNGNLTILDPIWTTAYVTRDHGYMIYDTLFSTDAKNAVQPQMVDKHDVSADKLLWTFTLRDGLEWHDGKPVTAEDCVASLKRWGARDPMGQKLMDFVGRTQAGQRQDLHAETEGAVRPGARHARQAVLERAVHDAQAHRRHRSVQADRQPDRLDPFIYVNAEFKPARRTSTSKTPYRAAAEPASGLAGGKIVKVDRVGEFVDMADPTQQVDALIAGKST